MDATLIGTTAAKLMESLGEEYGDDSEITAALVIVEVAPAGEEDTFVEWDYSGGYARCIGMAKIAGTPAPPRRAEDDDG